MNMLRITGTPLGFFSQFRNKLLSILIQPKDRMLFSTANRYVVDRAVISNTERTSHGDWIPRNCKRFLLSEGLIPRSRNLRSGPSFAQSRRSSHLTYILKRSVKPLHSLRVTTTFVAVLTALSITTPLLALNKPAAIALQYEILEPETWVGKEMPIMEHIDISGQFRRDNWLILCVITASLQKLKKVCSGLFWGAAGRTAQPLPVA